MKNSAIDMLLGLAVGDALGVPFEFSKREGMRRSPAKDMTGFQTHNQPPGTWSDDSSLTFCLAEALIAGYDLKTVSQYFIRWKNEAYWTARDEVFDIGITTSRAISRLESILTKGSLNDLNILKYQAEESDNGNGSLMRILPLVYEIRGKTIKDQFNIVWNNSALTHRHIRAGMSCMIYLKLAEYLKEDFLREDAYQNTRNDILKLWETMNFSEIEQKHFSRTIHTDLRKIDENDIKSGGYVIESLEASLWSFLTTNSFEEAVLTGINFGHDTDTTGAITGGLAGIYYGRSNIPQSWVTSLVRLEDIVNLGERLERKYS